MPRRPHASRLVRHAALAPALLALAPALAHAQSDRPVAPWERRSAPTLALGGAGLYAGAREGGGRLNDGGGFDVHASVGVSALSLGVGYQRSTQGLPGTGTRATLDGIFVEPRVAIAPYGNFTPYVAGRIGFLRQDVPASTAWRASRERVTQLGGGAGVLVSIAPNVSLDLGALYTHVQDRDRGAHDLALPARFEGGTGGAALLRAGLVIGFDRWGR